MALNENLPDHYPVTGAHLSDTNKVVNKLKDGGFVGGGGAEGGGGSGLFEPLELKILEDNGMDGVAVSKHPQFYIIFDDKFYENNKDVDSVEDFGQNFFMAPAFTVDPQTIALRTLNGLNFTSERQMDLSSQNFSFVGLGPAGGGRKGRMSVKVSTLILDCSNIIFRLPNGFNFPEYSPDDVSGDGGLVTHQGVPGIVKREEDGVFYVSPLSTKQDLDAISSDVKTAIADLQIIISDLQARIDVLENPA